MNKKAFFLVLGQLPPRKIAPRTIARKGNNPQKIAPLTIKIPPKIIALTQEIPIK